MSERDGEYAGRHARGDGSERPAPRGIAAGRGGDRQGAAEGGRVVVTARAPASDTAASRKGLDVICAGMYRACSTWQYEVVAHLLETHRSGRRLGYLLPADYARARRDEARTAGNPPAPARDWTVFKSHDAARCFARSVADGRAVVIYAYRDVRDVVFSLMHKRRLGFEALLRQGMIHQILANDRFWTRRRGLLVQRYDRILADPVGSVQELARSLGITPRAGEAERIADEYSLASNKARTEALKRQLEQQGVDLQEAANALICDEATLLHWNHVRDGSSGSWYGESTPRQRLILERLCGRWLRAHGYPRLPEGAPEDPAPGLRDRLAVERQILIGWVAYRVGAASRRWPGLAGFGRRLLGKEESTRGGALVWKEERQ